MEAIRIKNYYRSRVRGKIILLFTVCIVILIAVLVDLTLGSYNLSLIGYFRGIINNDLGNVDKLIMLNIRMPRSLTCIIVGMALGLSGYYMQTILQNPIASPFTLGISSAASFGASLSIITNFPFIFMGYNVQISAVFFSIVCTLVMIVALKKSNMDAYLMILAGVAINFFFVALQSLTQYVADEKQVQKIVHWMFGTVSKASWTGVIITTLTFIIIFIITYRKAWSFNLISFSDERAKSMGLDTEKFRRFIFLSSSILTAVAISYVGTIGFIGLLAPHFSRSLLGNDARFTATGSALLGGMLLIIASIVSKIILPGSLLPIGIIMNIVGVPFMIMIVARGKNGFKSI